MPRRRQPPPAGATLPTARELALPRSARDVYARLAEEPFGDWRALESACAAHVARFEAARSTNEFLPLAEARRLGAALPRLIERARAAGAPPHGERLAWIAARYFVLHEDGTHDFEVVGLDDDLAVFNAICRHLGFADLAIDPP